MSILDLFSKREKRRERQCQEDVFQYDQLPLEFRRQVIFIWKDALGVWQDMGYMMPALSGSYPSNRWWYELHHAVAREKGVFDLAEEGRNPFEKCVFYVQAAETKDALDLIEASFLIIDLRVRRLEPYEREGYNLVHPDTAIKELNARFREHGIGYEYAGGEIVRIDSKYLHAEAVKPALQLLHGAGRGFSGPLEEFLKAHEHHRKGEQKEAIINAAKAFESTLKAICTARGWAFDQNKDTAKDLIKIVFDQALIPTYLQNEFNGLRTVLESAVPTVRNRTAGHGQGATPTDVPDWLASYVLHMTAANIVLLIQAHKAK